MILYRFLPRQLDLQLALVCAIVLVCLMPWFIFLETDKELDYILENMENQSIVLARNIAANSADHLITGNSVRLEKVLKRSVLFPDVDEIKVTNHFGEVLNDVYINSNFKAESRTVTNRKKLQPPDENLQLSIINDNNIIIWSPIIGVTLLGWVRLTLTLERTNLHKEQRITDFFKDVSLITLVMILLLIFSMRRPLKMIREAADFSMRLESRSGEQIPITHQSIELDKLYLSLNKASTSLSEQEETIKKIVIDLEAQKRALDEHSIVSISDVDGNIYYANEKLLHSTGYKEQELIGKKYSFFKSDYHDSHFFSELWHTVKRGQVWHGDIVNLNKKRAKVWMKTTIVPFVDDNGSPYEYVTIQTDVTSQKKTEQQLAENNKSLQYLTNELENKVKSRTAELQKVNEDLIKMNNIKSDFVAVVSHELRTPLTSIKSFAEILEDDIDDLDSETRHRYIAIISEESERLGKLINNVLDLQKMDSGKMTWNLEKTNLKKLASTTIELFSKIFSDKNINLSLDIPEDELIANVDSDKIKQVLTNLLSNAYKFTEHGEVKLMLKKVIPHPTVLILDDDQENVVTVEELLKKLEIGSIMCSDEKTALDILKDRKQKINLMITDLSLSEKDVFKLIKSIRKIDKNIPLMILSSKVNNIIYKSLLDYEIAAFIDKKIVPIIFNNAIDTILGDSQYLNKEIQMVEISVIDSGMGIPEDELDKVFDSFHQVDNSETREKGGSGLGLSICQNIIEQHKGHLWVKSNYGAGSRFTFNLPLFDNSKKQIGEILIEAGVATQEEINNALSRQK